MSTPAPAPEKDPNVFNLKGGRLSFPHLWKPSAALESEGEPKYSATILLNKVEAKDQIEALKARIKQLIVTELKPLTSLPPDKICLRDGSFKADKEGYGDDVVYVAASDTRKPKVKDQKRNDMDENDPRVFAGCYVNMVIRLWSQNNKYGKRVNASLVAVQYLRTGEPFGAAQVDVDSVLDEEPEETEGDSMSLL